MAKTISPEFLLLAACCVWPPSARRDEAIRKAASSSIDWDCFLRTVKRHRVAGLAHNALSLAKVEMPAAIGDKIAAIASRALQRSLIMMAESAKLQALFDDAGIAAIFLKGEALAMLAYGRLGLKQAWDIDICVLPEAVERVSHLLAGAGYERVVPAADFSAEQFRKWMEVARECAFRHPKKQIVLELHWRLVDNPGLLPGLSAAAPTQDVATSGAHFLRTLNNEDLFAYLCVHGAMHGWSRLKWLADVAAFLTRYQQSEIENLYREAQARGAGRAPAQALVLCERLFGTDLPAALARELHAGRHVSRLADIALNAMAGGVEELDERPSAIFSVALSQFLLGYGWRYRFSLLHSKMFGWTDMEDVPLPDALRFLYPFIRLPSWFWRHVVMRKHPRPFGGPR